MRLGVLGSMVWDRIERPDAPTVERWGGISYSLAAAAAAAPDDWVIRAIVRVGDDLADQADAFLATLPVDRSGVMPVPEANNRVRLRYRDSVHRHECLTGGVGPWDWDDLEPQLEGLDGLYVNLISGFELELETAERIREAFDGPIYADLHSLLLGIAEGGHRVPRTLPDRDRWLAAFDVVQVNQPEFTLLGDQEDPWHVAEAAVRGGVAAVLVTGGPDGAAWIASGDRPRPWLGATATELHQGFTPSEEPGIAGDPTGCGDVWGATCFIRLMAGQSVSAAVNAANTAAAHNVKHRGADGLYLHLRNSP